MLNSASPARPIDAAAGPTRPSALLLRALGFAVAFCVLLFLEMVIVRKVLQAPAANPARVAAFALPVFAGAIGAAGAGPAYARLRRWLARPRSPSRLLAQLMALGALAWVVLAAVYIDVAQPFGSPVPAEGWPLVWGWLSVPPVAGIAALAAARWVLAAAGPGPDRGRVARTPPAVARARGGARERDGAQGRT